MIVYLSGGMHSGWQDDVIAICDEAQLSVIDPRKHGLDSPEQYTPWDHLGVRRADVLFAYWERDNPSGIGLALEVGYAKALGKLVVLVDETDSKYKPIVRCTADVAFDTIDEGLNYLRALGRMRP